MCAAKVANTTVVSKSNANDHTLACQVKSMRDADVPSKPTGTDSPFAKKAESPDMPLIRKKLNNKNLSTVAKDIIMASWRSGTGKQYHSYLGRWEKFCAQKVIPEEDASIEHGIDFLASLYEEGLGYSAINTARSALSSVLTLPGNVTFGKHPLRNSIYKRRLRVKTLPT